MQRNKGSVDIILTDDFFDSMVAESKAMGNREGPLPGGLEKLTSKGLTSLLRDEKCWVPASAWKGISSYKKIGVKNQNQYLHTCGLPIYQYSGLAESTGETSDESSGEEIDPTPKWTEEPCLQEVGGRRKISRKRSCAHIDQSCQVVIPETVGMCRLVRELGPVWVVNWGTSRYKPDSLVRWGNSSMFPKKLVAVMYKEDGKVFYASKHLESSPSAWWVCGGDLPSPLVYCRLQLMVSPTIREIPLPESLVVVWECEKTNEVGVVNFDGMARASPMAWIAMGCGSSIERVFDIIQIRGVVYCQGKKRTFLVKGLVVLDISLDGEQLVFPKSCVKHSTFGYEAGMSYGLDVVQVFDKPFSSPDFTGSLYSMLRARIALSANKEKLTGTLDAYITESKRGTLRSLVERAWSLPSSLRKKPAHMRVGPSPVVESDSAASLLIGQENIEVSLAGGKATKVHVDNHNVMYGPHPPLTSVDDLLARTVKGFPKDLRRKESVCRGDSAVWTLYKKCTPANATGAHKPKRGILANPTAKAKAKARALAKKKKQREVPANSKTAKAKARAKAREVAAAKESTRAGRCCFTDFGLTTVAIHDVTHGLQDKECYLLHDGVAYEGKIAVWRSPSFLPTDIEVWTAVLPPSGVVVPTFGIVCSTLGYGVANMAGGDYDGDLVHVSFCSVLVDLVIQTAGSCKVFDTRAMRLDLEKKLGPRKDVATAVSGEAFNCVTDYLLFASNLPTLNLRGTTCANAERAMQLALQDVDCVSSGSMERAWMFGIASHIATDFPKHFSWDQVTGLAKYLCLHCKVRGGSGLLRSAVTLGKLLWIDDVRLTRKQLLASTRDQLKEALGPQSCLGAYCLQSPQYVLGSRAGAAVAKIWNNIKKGETRVCKTPLRTELEELAFFLWARLSPDKQDAYEMCVAGNRAEIEQRVTLARKKPMHSFNTLVDSKHA